MHSLSIVPINADLSPYLGGYSVVAIAWYVLLCVALWKVFAKAGWPGILGIIPIVNVVILVKIAGLSGWLSLLYLIPIVGFVFGLIVAFRVGGRFGKGGGFSFFLLWLLAFIGYLILGFGSAVYRKPAGEA